MTNAALKRKFKKRLEKISDMASSACGYDGPLAELFQYEKETLELIMAEIKRARQGERFQ